MLKCGPEVGFYLKPDVEWLGRRRGGVQKRVGRIVVVKSIYLARRARLVCRSLWHRDGTARQVAGIGQVDEAGPAVGRLPLQ